MKYALSFILNGNPVDVLVTPTETLLDVIREKLRTVGPKRGCDSGDCGTCTVLLDNKPVRACLIIALTAAGKEITTVEGLVGSEGALDPLQTSFSEHGATQCGFCTPGMLICAKGLLNENPKPNREQIIDAISGNLCRCGAYYEIIEAIQALSRREERSSKDA